MRSIQKAINDYLKKFPADSKRGCFWSSDAYQVRSMSTDIWDNIFNALMAGFMVGYRYGKKENKNNNRV